jgi:hypothetical protein
MSASLSTCWLVTIWLLGAASVTSFSQTKDEQQVLDLSRRKFDWLIQGKADSLESLLDERLEYVHSNGWVQTRTEVLGDMKSGKLVYQQVIIKSAAARHYGQSAVVTGLGQFEGINSGNPFKLDLRYTEVYVRSGSRWKLVSRHSNRMP